MHRFAEKPYQEELPSKGSPIEKAQALFGHFDGASLSNELMGGLTALGKVLEMLKYLKSFFYSAWQIAMNPTNLFRETEIVKSSRCLGSCQ